MISVKNRKCHLNFVRYNEDHDISYWSKVLFSDKSKFNRLGSDGRQYVQQRKDEEFNPRCTVSMLQSDGGSVMVWSIISANGPGLIIRLQGRINLTKYINMLTEHFLPYFGQNLDDNPIFMQDNAPIHTAGNVKRFLEENDIPCLDWPALHNLQTSILTKTYGTTSSNSYAMIKSQIWKNFGQTRVLLQTNSRNA